MISWFVVVLVLVGVLVIIKLLHLRHFKHKIFSIFLVLIILFFVSTLYYVSYKNHLDLTTVNGFSNGMSIYAGWILNGFQNVKTVTGYAVGMDWRSTNGSLSKNSTNVNNSKQIEIIGVGVPVKKPMVKPILYNISK